MLPLITNVLPNTAPPPNFNNSGQATLLSTQVDAVSAARQQLPVAVAATGAPAAFSPNTPQLRQSQIDRRISAIITQTAAALGESDVPSQPFASVNIPAAPLPGSFFTSQPMQLNTPLTSQIATQLIAQDATEDLPELPSPDPSRPNTLPRGNAAASTRSSFVLPHLYMSPLSLPASTLRTGQMNSQGEWRTAPVPKKPGITARGQNAYRVAEIRNRIGASSTDATL